MRMVRRMARGDWIRNEYVRERKHYRSSVDRGENERERERE